MELLMILLVTVSPLISDGLTVRGPSAPLVAPLGSSVVFLCYVDKPLPMEGLEVEWRRPDSETLIHLYQDGKSQTEVQQQDYQNRAHFFTDQIQHGNFSLRLDDLRAEDAGEYTCTVHSQQKSGETVVQINVDVERLLVSGSSRSISAYVGEDVTLNCSIDSNITLQDTEQVLWKKTDEDEDIIVLLFQDQVVRPEASDERYGDRVEFFIDEIPKLNFSLRLKSVRTEDKGVYMCEVFAGGLSANTTVQLERLGFSVLHIVVLILCISASGSALLLCCLIYCRSLHKGFLGQHTHNHQFNLGSSVVLPCHVDECLLKKGLKVEWRRKDTKTLVHLYQDGESQTEKQQQDYQNRAHFFTDQIQHGNFSLRLDDLRAEDAGEYTCTVYSDLSTVTRTAETSLVPRFKVKGSSDDETVPLGDSVVLSCQVNKSLLEKSLKVEWRRADSETLVHLYEDGESRANKQHKDYHHRAHFSKKIKDGNFSLRLDKLRAEDAGKYTCKVYSEEDCVHSADAELEMGFGVKCHIRAPLGSSVVLSSYGQKPLPVKGLKVEWRRTDVDSDSDSSDSETLVHLYQDGESQTEVQQQDYQNRAHFFTDQIQHGNFSLRLDDLRAEDAGEYTCTVHSKSKHVISVKTNLILRLLDPVFRLHMSLVFCPNLLMFLAFILWGVSEGSVSETVCCCALYFLRPLLLLWAAPYIYNFTGRINSLSLEYSYVVEYFALSLVVYSVLVTEIWKKTGRIVKIFDLVADMTFQILPTLQFILLFYTFGAGGEAGLIMIVVLPVLLMMMTNERWIIRCSNGLGLSPLVVRTVMLIFILVTNALMIGLYIFTLENQTDPIGWGCVMVFLQILWTVMFFTDADLFYTFLRLSRDFRRYVSVYVFGSVAVVLLNSAALTTELILKTVNGDRMMADLRFIVFPSECLFAVSLLISGFSGSKIADCLKSCQTKMRSVRVRRSPQQNQNTGETQEMDPLNA
ncbi:uncharacterized protein LOC127952143 isoform X2 [Carassius gibelio]|uniref:uncharacterized protein LOC127952143 isoform X2 n=1 Tax=Carassius gibelio TaxID=101364 RepID=UPI002279233F|nr:uncharacterized protein LOC127952143 isoform X2 [Carassius gibelio]